MFGAGIAYTYLERAMAARWEPPLVEKTGLSRLQPYDNWRECRTVGELAAIAENPNAIHMEGLCIRERILGRVAEHRQLSNGRSSVFFTFKVI